MIFIVWSSKQIAYRIAKSKPFRQIIRCLISNHVSPNFTWPGVLIRWTENLSYSISISDIFDESHSLLFLLHLWQEKDRDSQLHQPYRHVVATFANRRPDSSYLHWWPFCCRWTNEIRQNKRVLKLSNLRVKAASHQAIKSISLGRHFVSDV